MSNLFPSSDPLASNTPSKKLKSSKRAKLVSIENIAQSTSTFIASPIAHREDNSEVGTLETTMVQALPASSTAASAPVSVSATAPHSACSTVAKLNALSVDDSTNVREPEKRAYNS